MADSSAFQIGKEIKRWILVSMAAALLATIVFIVARKMNEEDPVPEWFTPPEGPKVLVSGNVGEFHWDGGIYYYLRMKCPQKPGEVVEEMTKILRVRGDYLGLRRKPAKGELSTRDRALQLLGLSPPPSTGPGTFITNDNGSITHYHAWVWPSDQGCTLEYIEEDNR